MERMARQRRQQGMRWQQEEGKLQQVQRRAPSRVRGTAAGAQQQQQPALPVAACGTAYSSPPLQQRALPGRLGSAAAGGTATGAAEATPATATTATRPPSSASAAAFKMQKKDKSSSGTLPGVRESGSFRGSCSYSHRRPPAAAAAVPAAVASPPQRQAGVAPPQQQAGVAPPQQQAGVAPPQQQAGVARVRRGFSAALPAGVAAAAALPRDGRPLLYAEQANTRKTAAADTAAEEGVGPRGTGGPGATAYKGAAAAKAATAGGRRPEAPWMERRTRDRPAPAANTAEAAPRPEVKLAVKTLYASNSRGYSAALTRMWCLATLPPCCRCLQRQPYIRACKGQLAMWLASPVPPRDMVDPLISKIKVSLVNQLRPIPSLFFGCHCACHASSLFYEGGLLPLGSSEALAEASHALPQQQRSDHAALTQRHGPPKSLTNHAAEAADAGTAAVPVAAAGDAAGHAALPLRGKIPAATALAALQEKVMLLLERGSIRACLMEMLRFRSQNAKQLRAAASNPGGDNAKALILALQLLTLLAAVDSTCHRRCWQANAKERTKKAVTQTMRGAQSLVDAWKLRQSCVPPQWQQHFLCLARVLRAQAQLPVASKYQNIVMEYYKDPAARVHALPSVNRWTPFCCGGGQQQHQHGQQRWQNQRQCLRKGPKEQQQPQPSGCKAHAEERVLRRLAENLAVSPHSVLTTTEVYLQVSESVEEEFSLRAFLFGSVASGCGISSSDVDVLVVLPEAMQHRLLREAYSSLDGQKFCMHAGSLLAPWTASEHALSEQVWRTAERVFNPILFSSAATAGASRAAAATRCSSRTSDRCCSIATVAGAAASAADADASSAALAALTAKSVEAGELLRRVTAIYAARRLARHLWLRMHHFPPACALVWQQRQHKKDGTDAAAAASEIQVCVERAACPLLKTLVPVARSPHPSGAESDPEEYAAAAATVSWKSGSSSVSMTQSSSGNAILSLPGSTSRSKQHHDTCGWGESSSSGGEASGSTSSTCGCSSSGSTEASAALWDTGSSGGTDGRNDGGAAGAACGEEETPSIRIRKPRRFASTDESLPLYPVIQTRIRRQRRRKLLSRGFFAHVHPPPVRCTYTRKHLSAAEAGDASTAATAAADVERSATPAEPAEAATAAAGDTAESAAATDAGDTQWETLRTTRAARARTASSACIRAAAPAEKAAAAAGETLSSRQSGSSNRSRRTEDASVEKEEHLWESGYYSDSALPEEVRSMNAAAFGRCCFEASCCHSYRPLSDAAAASAAAASAAGPAAAAACAAATAIPGACPAAVSSPCARDEHPHWAGPQRCCGAAAVAEGRSFSRRAVAAKPRAAAAAVTVEAAAAAANLGGTGGNVYSPGALGATATACTWRSPRRSCRPLLRWVHVDVVFSDEVAVHNTRLVRAFSCCFGPQIQNLFRLIKCWIKQRQICDAFRGTLSSYAWLLTAIFFLQRSLICRRHEAYEWQSSTCESSSHSRASNVSCSSSNSCSSTNSSSSGKNSSRDSSSRNSSSSNICPRPRDAWWCRGSGVQDAAATAAAAASSPREKMREAATQEVRDGAQVDDGWERLPKLLQALDDPATTPVLPVLHCVPPCVVALQRRLHSLHRMATRQQQQRGRAGYAAQQQQWEAGEKAPSQRRRGGGGATGEGAEHKQQQHQQKEGVAEKQQQLQQRASAAADVRGKQCQQIPRVNRHVYDKQEHPCTAGEEEQQGKSEVVRPAVSSTDAAVDTEKSHSRIQKTRAAAEAVTTASTERGGAAATDTESSSSFTYAHPSCMCPCCCELRGGQQQQLAPSRETKQKADRAGVTAAAATAHQDAAASYRSPDVHNNVPGAASAPAVTAAAPAVAAGAVAVAAPDPAIAAHFRGAAGGATRGTGMTDASAGGVPAAVGGDRRLRGAATCSERRKAVALMRTAGVDWYGGSSRNSSSNSNSSSQSTNVESEAQKRAAASSQDSISNGRCLDHKGERECDRVHVSDSSKDEGSSSLVDGSRTCSSFGCHQRQDSSDASCGAHSSVPSSRTASAAAQQQVCLRPFVPVLREKGSPANNSREAEGEDDEEDEEQFWIGSKNSIKFFHPLYGMNRCLSAHALLCRSKIHLHGRQQQQQQQHRRQQRQDTPQQHKWRSQKKEEENQRDKQSQQVEGSWQEGKEEEEWEEQQVCVWPEEDLRLDNEAYARRMLQSNCNSGRSLQGSVNWGRGDSAAAVIDGVPLDKQQLEIFEAIKYRLLRSSKAVVPQNLRPYFYPQTWLQQQQQLQQQDPLLQQQTPLARSDTCRWKVLAMQRDLLGLFGCLLRMPQDCEQQDEQKQQQQRRRQVPEGVSVLLRGYPSAPLAEELPLSQLLSGYFRFLGLQFDSFRYIVDVRRAHFFPFSKISYATASDLCNNDSCNDSGSISSNPNKNNSRDNRHSDSKALRSNVCGNSSGTLVNGGAQSRSNGGGSSSSSKDLGNSSSSCCSEGKQRVPTGDGKPLPLAGRSHGGNNSCGSWKEEETTNAATAAEEGRAEGDSSESEGEYESEEDEGMQGYEDPEEQLRLLPAQQLTGDVWLARHRYITVQDPLEALRTLGTHDTGSELVAGELLRAISVTSAHAWASREEPASALREADTLAAALAAPQCEEQSCSGVRKTAFQSGSLLGVLFERHDEEAATLRRQQRQQQLLGGDNVTLSQTKKEMKKQRWLQRFRERRTALPSWLIFPSYNRLFIVEKAGLDVWRKLNGLSSAAAAATPLAAVGVAGSMAPAVYRQPAAQCTSASISGSTARSTMPQ